MDEIGLLSMFDGLNKIGSLVLGLQYYFLNLIGLYNPKMIVS